MAFDRVNVLLTNNIPEKAIVQSRGIIIFSSRHDIHRRFWRFAVVIWLSDMNQLSLVFLQTLWFVPHFGFVVTSHVSLVLLYHDLTPTIIKGQDIESVDIWERWWMWLWAGLALRQIPGQICDKVQQCLFFPAQNKLLNCVWWNHDLGSLNQF